MARKDRSWITDELIERAEEQITAQTKRIDYYLTEYTIELLAQKMSNGDFEIPDYQRNFTWEPERKSRFIESVLMALPIPFLFFWVNPETGGLEIVDGSQRLRTIQEFILGDLELGDMDQLPLLKGLRFHDLPESRQRKIKNRSIRGIVLNEFTDEEARLDLFDRINTGSKNANAAEIRRGALRGAFLDLIVELSESHLFMKLAPVSTKQASQREREELVTRFFAYGDGLEGYRDKVATFLFNYVKTMNEYLALYPLEEQIYRQRFLTTMSFVEKNFPWGFRRLPNANVTPRTRFEAIAVGCWLALEKNPRLMNQKVEVEKWLQSPEFLAVTTSDGANPIARLERRIYFVCDQLLGD